MTLYHGTWADKLDSILEFGLEPQVSTRLSHDTRLNQVSVYGFDNLQDAIDFMVYDSNEQNWAVVSFEADNCVIDPEYGESSAFAVITDDNIPAKFVCKNED